MKRIITLTLSSFISLAMADNLKIVKTYSQNIQNTKELTANIYSPKETVVSSRLTGYIKNIRVEEGDYVKKGQILFEIDPVDVESQNSMALSQLNQAKSNLIISKTNFADAQKDYERFKNLFEKGAISAREFEKISLNLELKKQSVEIAKSTLQQAESGLNQAKNQYKYASVTSPINGVIIKKLANIAELSTPAKPVLIVSNTSDLQAQAQIPDSDISSIKIGEKVNLNINNRQIGATIKSIVPNSDINSHSFIVKFKLNESKGLIPGMYAKLILNSNNSNEVIIPISSITKRSGIKGVFVVNGQSIKFNPVTVKKEVANGFVVSGIANGVEIIDYPKENLIDGMKIR